MQPLALMKKWFTGALDTQYRRKERKTKTTIVIVIFPRALSAAFFSAESNFAYEPTKKGESSFAECC
jgi:hypothetical protein